MEKKFNKNNHIYYLKMDFLRKNRIESGFKYSYDNYLLEFINNSKIVNEYGDQKFRKIEPQSRGEADIENDFITFDFKLFADKNTMECKNLYESHYFEIVKGIFGRYYNDKQKIYRITDLFARILWNTRKDNLKDEIECYSQLVNILSVEKNLIICIPIRIEHTNIKPIMNVLHIVVSHFKKAFIMINKIRKKYVNNKNMYVSFILNDNFIIVG